MPPQLGTAARLKLVQTLNAMPTAQFEEIVQALNPPKGILPSLMAAQGNRASELLNWAEGPTGRGLEEVLEVLAAYVPLPSIGISLPGGAGTAPSGRPKPPTAPSMPPIPAPFKTTKEVFISYAWGGESEELVNTIDAAFQDKDITLIRDKRNLGYKGDIKAFMEQIGRGKAVVVVISDKYLKSENCMFELVEIAENGDYRDRIFPIVLPDANIYKPVQRIRYIQHWEQEIADLDAAMKTVSSANLQGFRESIDLYTRIRNAIADLVETLKNMNTLTPDMHSDSGFTELFAAIEQRLNT